MIEPNKNAGAKIICNFFATGAFLVGIGGTLTANDQTILYWFSGLGFSFFLMSWGSNRRVSKWRNWAKEKGYTE